MDALGAATVLGTSIVKFLFAAAVSYGLGHSFWETVALLALGGSTGITAFYLLGSRLLDALRLRRLHSRIDHMAKGRPPKRTFTRTNRFIVRSKRAYGLIGLVLMPPLLSVPVTALIAAKYFRHDGRTLPLLLASVAGWSMVLSIAWGFLR